MKNDNLFEILIEQKAKMLAWDDLDGATKRSYIELASKDLEDNYYNLASGLAKVLKKHSKK